MLRKKRSSPAFHNPAGTMVLRIADELGRLSTGGVAAMRAATALKHAAMQPHNAGAIVSAGGVPALVALLSAGNSPELQDEAAAVLRALCMGSSAHRAAICDAGAVPLLLELLLVSDAAETQEQAAGLLSSLAMAPDGASAIMTSEGAQSLLDVCSSTTSCDGAKLDAANALHALAATSSGRVALIDAGAPSVLAAMQRDGGPALARGAQAALKRLQGDNAKGSAKPIPKIDDG